MIFTLEDTSFETSGTAYPLTQHCTPAVAYRKSEVLTKLRQIPSSVENTSVTT
jgi:hypothetical protein